MLAFDLGGQSLPDLAFDDFALRRVDLFRRVATEDAPSFGAQDWLENLRVVIRADLPLKGHHFIGVEMVANGGIKLYAQAIDGDHLENLVVAHRPKVVHREIVPRRDGVQPFPVRLRLRSARGAPEHPDFSRTDGRATGRAGGEREANDQDDRLTLQSWILHGSISVRVRLSEARTSTAVEGDASRLVQAREALSSRIAGVKPGATAAWAPVIPRASSRRFSARCRANTTRWRARKTCCSSTPVSTIAA